MGARQQVVGAWCKVGPQPPDNRICMSSTLSEGIIATTPHLAFEVRTDFGVADRDLAKRDARSERHLLLVARRRIRDTAITERVLAAVDLDARVVSTQPNRAEAIVGGREIVDVQHHDAAAEAPLVLHLRSERCRHRRALGTKYTNMIIIGFINIF